MARVICPPLSYFSIFPEVLGRRGRLFWNDCNDTDVTHIFKGKGKLNRIKKLPYPICYIFCFSLRLVPLCRNLSLRKGHFYLLPALSVQIQSEYRKIKTRNSSLFGHFTRSAGIAITTTSDWWNQRKKPSVKTNSIIVKNGGNEQMAYYAPEISKLFRSYDYGITLHLWLIFFTCILKVDEQRFLYIDPWACVNS